MSRRIGDYEITCAMQKFGGSFAKALAEAVFRADDDHRARIKAAFPELWAEYAEMARLSQEREAART